jgi:acyl carrier protein
VGNTDTLDRMQRIFRDVLDDDALVLRPELTAADVENWDSLSHIDLLVGVEREFKVKFTTADIASLENVGDLVTVVDRKRAALS